MRSPERTPASAAGEPSIGVTTTTPAVLGGNLDADAGIAARGRQPHLVVLLGVEKCGMRVEIRDDALDGGLLESGVSAAVST